MNKVAALALIFFSSAIHSRAEVGTYLTEQSEHPARNSAAVDSTGVIHRGIDYGHHPLPWLTDVTKKVPTEYPYVERARHHTGAGIFRITINLDSGAVENVSVVKSIGFRRLDDCAIAALRKWRWTPGKWKQVDLPVTFTIAQPPAGVRTGTEGIR